jgi:hypothetical protein
MEGRLILSSIVKVVNLFKIQKLLGFAINM